MAYASKDTYPCQVVDTGRSISSLQSDPVSSNVCSAHWPVLNCGGKRRHDVSPLLFFVSHEGPQSRRSRPKLGSRILIDILSSSCGDSVPQYSRQRDSKGTM